MDLFTSFNKVSRAKYLPFKKIGDLKKGDIFRVYSMVNQTSPWGPKLYLNCDEQNFSIPLPTRIRDELLSLPGGIDGINQVLKNKPTYVYYETPTNPILTEIKTIKAVKI